ncbi:PAS domain S-box-containing protein [Palleronia aestuarii]|uniref:histidine kinase n=1 Tax=Palleronia aestuarii TaxID=568105 RepID=A0A2W7P4D5_9RHOB|nr:PAS domain-containing protein [Palleronia aestuarii]PZX18262.1 PAS domain S-box-containing protein [Palleronia aestuarii]
MTDEPHETTPPTGSQASMVFDDSPNRFRASNVEQKFDGASGVLFEQAMAQTRMAIVLADPAQEDMPIVFVNRAFTELTGYSEDEVVGKNCRFLQGEKSDPAVVARIRQALESEDVVVVELLNYRRDGTPFWNALHLGPIYSTEGKLLYYFGSQWDVSDVRAARAEEQHAKMMARELSHRMKNMFAVIGGLITVTGRTKNIREEAAEINDRIRALGRAFETTLDEASRGSVELEPAVKAVLTPYDPDGNRIRFEGESLRVDPNVISTVGLAMHELATNAIKHGALREQTGEITLKWVAQADDGLEFVWRESGGPTIEKPECGVGSGLGIIDNLLKTVGGSLEHDWQPGGFVARISFPHHGRAS